jgi:OmpA family
MKPIKAATVITLFVIGTCIAFRAFGNEQRYEVHFLHGGAALLIEPENGFSTLDEVAMRMKQKDLRAQIIGYSQPDEKDPPGGRMGTLAERRAGAVKTYLVTQHGIDPARMTTAGEKSSTRSAVITLVQQ